MVTLPDRPDIQISTSQTLIFQFRGTMLNYLHDQRLIAMKNHTVQTYPGSARGIWTKVLDHYYVILFPNP
jgi:hypothetical protein